MEPLKTARGRLLQVLGDPALLTMDRMAEFTKRFDGDPRIVTCSLVSGTGVNEVWVRATAPAGVLVAIAEDAQDLVGPLPADDDVGLAAWFRATAERGLWHDHYLTHHRDVAKASALMELAAMDAQEGLDPSSAAFAAQHGEKHDALGRLTLFQLVAGQAGLLQKAVDRLRRSGGGRALHFFRAAFAGGGDFVGNQPKPARGSIGGDDAMREAGSLQRINEPRAQLLRGSRLHARRDFFGLEFKEELHLPCSTQQSATAFTRSRTRPI